MHPITLFFVTLGVFRATWTLGKFIDNWGEPR